MNMEVVIQGLLLTEHYIQNVTIYRPIVERLLLDVKYKIEDLCEKKISIPQEVLQKLDLMCRDMYNFCKSRKKKYPRREYGFDPILNHLITIRKLVMFSGQKTFPVSLNVVTRC